MSHEETCVITATVVRDPGRFSRAMAMVLYLLAGCAAWAQINTGRIAGTVADTSGALVPGANVEVVNQTTARTWKAVTDAQGVYRFLNLPAGTYDVAVQLTGFRGAEQKGFDLVSAGSITADFKLEVGTIQESIVVTAAAGEMVNTISGEVSRTVDSQQVQDLALNGRNYMQLVTLIPGVAVTSLDQMAMTTSMATSNQSMNGGRATDLDLMVDGSWNMDSGSNASQINNVGVDFIRELTVQSSAFSAEFGRKAGASINVVTKAGGSHFHGTLFEMLRNERLDARSYFATNKPPLRFNDFGWSLGGPLKTGKLFFFAGQEWKKIRRFAGPTRATLPTTAEMNGDFSGRSIATVYYPGTTMPVPDKNVTSLMTSDGKAIMGAYRALSKLASVYADTPAGNNTTFYLSNPFNFRQDIVRVDWYLTDRLTTYVRYLHDMYDSVDPMGTWSGNALTPTHRYRPGYGLQLAYTWTANPRLTNDGRANVSWHSQRLFLQGQDWQRNTYGFQFPLIFGGGNGQYPTGIPNVSVSGFSSLVSPANVYMASPTTDIGLYDNMTYVREKHVIRAGFSLIRNRQDANQFAPYLGSVAFNASGNNQTTGYAMADAALGLFRTYSEINSSPIGFYRFTQPDAFVQDTWRLSSRLSIEAGLRYSRFLPQYTVANNLANFVPALYDRAQAVTVTKAGLIVAGSGNPWNGIIRAANGVPPNQVGRVPGATDPATLAVAAGAPRGLYHSANLFMPRLSLAWAPFARSRTAVRAGFGAFHDRPPGNVVNYQTLLPPYSYSVQYENGNLSNPSGGIAASPAPLGGIRAIDPDLKSPAVYNYNFGVQHELPLGLFMDLSYVGNLARHLIRLPDVNQPSFDVLTANQVLPSAERAATNAIRPYPGYSSISMSYSDSNSNYNALQVYLTKRKGNSNFSLSYTWSKALSDASSNTDSGDLVETNNRRYNYGPTSFDRRQILVATYTYRLPLLRQSRGVWKAAFAGWEVSGITRAQSGPKLTPTANTTIGTRRAQYLGGATELPSDLRGPNQWFNPMAFAAAPDTELGNAGVGILTGPAWQNWDVSLRKVFRVHEGWNLHFQADAFNFLNRAIFNAPSAGVTGGSFGMISSSQPPRNVQLGLRLAF